MQGDQHHQALCGVCASIDLASYFRQAVHVRIIRDGVVGASPAAVQLGLFRDIYRKSHSCAFCSLVVHALCTTYSWCVRTPERILAQDPRMECWIYSYFYADNGADSTRGGPVYRIGIATAIGHGNHGLLTDQAGVIQLLEQDAAKVNKGGSTFFYGRLVHPERVAVERLRAWLERCEREHGMLCESPPSSLPVEKPRGLLVIDVKRRCICNLPPGERYVALSYCWPAGETTKLLRGNIEELREVGALTGWMKDLPGTIRDAVDFTQEFGEAYLWVDALCIIQDSDEHKHFQLSQMDKVYGSAVMTVVAAVATADPADACRGLPCYRAYTRRKRQKVAVVQNLHLAVPFEAVISLLDLSRWDSRAWTYQEGLLSKRLLYFTDTQVYFQCACNVFCEDGVGEGIDPTAYISPRGNLWNPGGRYDPQGTAGRFGSRHLQQMPYETSMDAVSEYGSVIEYYTTRNLTYPSDILDAFQGVQSVMERSMATRFWYGLPEAYLDRCLLWSCTGPQRRRTTPSPPTSHPHSMPYFPTWSWAGWDGHVELRSYFGLPGIQPEVRWLLINEYRDAILLQTKGLKGKFSFPQSGNQELNMIHDLPIDNLLAGGTLKQSFEIDPKGPEWRSPKYLASWTMLAEFQMTGHTVSLDDHGKLWQHGDNMAITNSRGEWAGSVIVDRHLFASMTAPPQRTQKTVFEFILISRSEEIFYESYPSIQHFDVGVFTKRPWCLLNVMLVERRREGGVEVASRVSVGVIHEDAWVAANPVPTFIRLE